MSEQADIIYFAFWDVPLTFVVRHRGLQLLFDRGDFDDELDDWPPTYKVYLLPDIPDEEVKQTRGLLQERAGRYLGEIPYHQIEFDESKRKRINTRVIDKLIGSGEAWQTA